MRIKIFATVFFLAALAVLGTMAYWKLQATKEKKALNDELKKCMGWITSNQHAKAQETLERILDEHADLTEADAIWAKLAESYEATSGKEAQAARCRQKIHDDFPTSPHFVKSVSLLASRQSKINNAPKAQEYWNLIVNNYADSEYVPEAQFGLTLLRHAGGEQAKLREALWELRTAYPESSIIPEVEKMLGEINLDLLYMAGLGESEDEAVYVIKKGDTLDGIGRRSRVSPDLLMKVNNIPDPRVLGVGKRLKIPKTDFSIIVDKTDNTLILNNHGKFFKRYYVRTGKVRGLTPNGSFSINQKKKNPSWTRPDGTTIPAGDPENALGVRWMPFDTTSALGIHGTNEPDSIGTYASSGCVGMQNKDVIELYDLVRIGTKIEITGETKKK